LFHYCTIRDTCSVSIVQVDELCNAHASSQLVNVFFVFLFFCCTLFLHRFGDDFKQVWTQFRSE